MLAELDDEFGVSAVVTEQLKPKKPKVNYSSASLEGLKVEHSVDRFVEGTPIILTLKDSGMFSAVGIRLYSFWIHRLPFLSALKMC